MREAEEVKGFWLPLPAFTPIRCRMNAESNQSRFVGMYLEAEALQALLEIGPETDRVGFVLEAHHEIVSVAHDDHLAACSPLSPLLYPQVEDVMKVDVRKERRDRRSLRRSFIRRRPLSTLESSGGKPLLD
jgi:hypothetical protein